MPQISYQPLPPELYSEIKIVCDMMLKVHYYEPANWLWMALSAPQSCSSIGARTALAEARTIARQFGFPRVAKWVEQTMQLNAAAATQP